MFGSYTATSSRCLRQVFLVDQQLDVLYGLSIPNAYAFITEEIDGSDVMIASTSGDVVSSGNIRISPSESTNADIRKAYSYLTSEKTNGMSISALENQTEVRNFTPFHFNLACCESPLFCLS
jgi:hypothetical protein